MSLTDCRTQKMNHSRLVIAVPLSIFSTFVVASNALVCVLVLSRRRMRTYTNGFVVSLALSDIMTGIAMFIQYNAKLHHVSRAIVNLIYSFVFFCGVFNLCAVTYDRYLAVKKPFQYETTIAKVFKVSVPSIWIVSLLFSALPFTWKAHTNGNGLLVHKIYILISLFGVSFVCYGFILVANFCIFRVVKQSVRRERELCLSVQTVGNESTSRHLRIVSKIYSEAKIARVFVSVVLMFIISWFPTIVHSSAAALGRSKSVPAAILDMSPFTIVLGSAVNPVIYSFMKPDIRQVMQKTFCKK